MALTPEELVRFAKACGIHEALVLFAGLTGLRWAEIIGLRVSDIDLNSGRVVVEKSISEVDGYFHEKSTKSGQSRVVAIPRYLNPYLEKQIQNKEQTEYLFSNGLGKPMSLSNFTQRVFKPAIKIAGIPPITPHDLRHTAASNAIRLGGNILNVKHMLGHQDTRVTLNTYGHLFDEDQNLLAASINTKFSELANKRN